MVDLLEGTVMENVSVEKLTRALSSLPEATKKRLLREARVVTRASQRRRALRSWAPGGALYRWSRRARRSRA